jgi:hypothetical protein
VIQRPPTKRRARRVKPGELAAYYAKLRNEGPDVVLHNEPPARRADAHFLHCALNVPRFNHKGEVEPSVMEELQARGYDITTLRFSIQMAAESKGEK